MVPEKASRMPPIELETGNGRLVTGGSETGLRHYRGTVLMGVAASAAAVLTLEVTLTRVFAVIHFHHFAFLTVSLALLGFGVSGTALAVLPRLGRGGPRRWAMLAAAQGTSTLLAFVVANRIPFDTYAVGWDRPQLLSLAATYLVLAIPFFCGGAVTGALLGGWDQPQPIGSHRVYAANLAGSGVGALAGLYGIGWFGGPGMIALAAALAACAAVAFAAAASGPRRGGVTASTALALLLVVTAIGPPALLDLRLSQYKGLTAALRVPDAEVVSTRWSASARVDHVRSSAIRSLPGLSYAFSGAVPVQDGLTRDGDDLSPVAVTSEPVDFAGYMLGAIATLLRPGGDVLVMNPRGGLDVLVALGAGAGAVTAVESDGLVVTAAREVAGSVYDDPRVEVVVAEPRSYVERTRARYDVISLALTAPYRPVTSGAYSLAEDYMFTVEAFAAYLDRLEPGGILSVMRWLQTPPSEEVRLVALAAAAARRVGADPGSSVVALRGYSTVIVMIKPDGFDAAELAAISGFGESRRFDLMAAPGLLPASANRFNVLPRDDYYSIAAALLRGDDPGYPAFDISPPTDDRPFFGDYFTWSQTRALLDSMGHAWRPFGGAGILVLVAMLVLAVVAAAVLVLLPLAVAGLRARRGVASGIRVWTVAYFGLLGFGFLFVEIPLVQSYILLVGEPTVALAVVLFGLLLASGAGSLLSPRLHWRGAATVLVGLAAATPWILGGATTAILGMTAAARIAVGVIVLVPLGLLMGVMFPRGIAHLERVAPEMIPWAWAVNGTVSVVTAVVAVLVALSGGFRLVFMLGAGCYALCIPLARPGRREFSPE